MGRCPLSEESGVKKGPWTPEEDDKLINYIHKHGHGSWRALPKLAGLNRCGKSCRLRWTNYLRPDIKRGKFSQDEEQTILNLHAILGNKWSAIATHLPGRTDNEIKNFWNTHLKKKLIQMGFDPMTHRPRTDIFSTLPHLMALANLIDNPASWDDQLIRLQAEAVQMARLNHCLTNLLQPPLLHASILDSPATAPPSFPEALFLQETTPFSHLPDLQAPCSNNNMIDESKLGVMVQGDFVGVVNQEENSPACSSPWMQPAAVETNSITKTQLDACSSSYGGTAHIWSELFDDPIFQEIA